MPNIWEQAERDQDSVQRDYEEGLISSAEAARYMREIQRDARDAAREEREEAHRDLDDRMGW